MKREDAIAVLKEHETELRQLGVEHLYLFGSTARGETREDSDVDLFFNHPEGSLGLYQLMDVKDTAVRILRRKTDIMTRRSLHPVRAARHFRQPSVSEIAIHALVSEVFSRLH